jgi:hypothetical protein
VPILLLNSVFCLLDTAMRPNLRSNRNQTPLKLVDANPTPAQPKKPKKRSKKKPTRRKAPTTAPTAAEQLVALQRLRRVLNKVTKPAERGRSRTATPNRPPPSAQPRTLQQRFAEISSSPPDLADLPEVSTFYAGALPVRPSSLMLPVSSRKLVATSPYIEEEDRVLDKPYEIEWIVRAGKELQWADGYSSHYFNVEDRIEEAIESINKKINPRT